MKKLLSVIFALIMLLTGLSLTAFALDRSSSSVVETDEYVIDFDKVYEPMYATLSDDYKTLTVDGKTYSEFDISDFDIELFTIISYDGSDNFLPYREISIELSEKQKENFETVNFQGNANYNIITVKIQTKSGGAFTASYLNDECLAELEAYKKGEGVYTIDFEYPSDNEITIEKEQLYGKEETLKGSKVLYCLSFDVSMDSTNKTFSKDGNGFLLITEEDEYYYLNKEENGIGEVSIYSEVYYDQRFTVYEITDADVCAKIEECHSIYQEYCYDEIYDDDYNVLYDNTATHTIAKVLLVILFALVPLAILVVFLIKTFKAKGVYVKLYAVVSALCLAELIAFIIAAVNIF